MDFWVIEYTPLQGDSVTQSSEAWSLSNLKRHRVLNGQADTVTFAITVQDASTPLPFAYNSTITIFRNGARWFVGTVRKPAAQLMTKSQVFIYEIAGPWSYLERTIFQQQWVTGDATGGATGTATTTQGDVTLGQSLNLVKMNSGQVITEALRYAQYAYQMQPYPTTVDVNNLPPLLPTQAKGPYLIGMISPTIVVPYSEVRDKSCADIIRLMLKYSPDAVAWFDYTTTPPTININQRASLPSRTIARKGPPVQSISATPRYDLQPPVVVAKFQSNEVINGESFAILNVQSYPPPPAGTDIEVWRSQTDAWVQTVDLVGGSIDYLKQTVSVTSRPHGGAETSEQIRAWLVRHATTLADQYDFSADTVASTALTITDVTTVVDPNSPALKAPYNMPADGSGYNYELVDGAVTPWMYDDGDSLLCADATVKITLKYVGTDPATLNYFNAQPTPGTLIVPVRCKITNAGGQVGWTSTTATNEYSTEASESQGEPVPDGFAQSLWTSLSQLHFVGTILLKEQQCSDLLPPGFVFNITGGNPAWAAMDALVLSVTEDIDRGTTSVQFGPPIMLGLQELAELFRANLGRLPSYKLAQRDTGKTSDGTNTVQGPSQTASSSTTLPPGGGGGDTQPFSPRDSSLAGTPRIGFIVPGMVNGLVPTGDPVTVPLGAGILYVQFDQTYDAVNNVTKVTNSFQSVLGDTSAVPPRTLVPGGTGGGSGTFYWPICSFVATISGGVAKCVVKRLVNGSINFAICNGAYVLPA